MKRSSKFVFFDIFSFGSFIKRGDKRGERREKESVIGVTDNFKGFESSFGDLVVGRGEGGDKEERDMGEEGSIDIGLGFFLDDVAGGGEESDLGRKGE